MKTFEKAEITAITELAPGIFDMKVKTAMGQSAKAGQFAMLYPNDKSTLLPRPISICEADETGLRFVFRVVGKGTKEFSEYKEGDFIKLCGPLGNGYDTDFLSGKKVIVLGGGIGIPPMLGLSKELAAKGIEVTAVMGYRDNNMFLKEDFEKYCNIYVATEDGSFGTKGNVLDCMEKENLFADVLCACGPMPMLRAIKHYAEDKNIEAFISLEERMACGVGACLGCVTKTVSKDHHSHVNNARVCTEGPVFNAREVDI